LCAMQLECMLVNVAIGDDKRATHVK
jgi:hypothetical protein